MTDDQLKPSDRLYFAIAALRGWDDVEARARSWGGADARRFGQLLSSILLAVGDDAEPLAVAGELNDEWSGNLAVIYDGLIVVADVTEMKDPRGSVVLAVYGFDAISEVQVTARHNYFDGVDSHPRHKGMHLKFTLAGRAVSYPPQGWGRSPLITDDAAMAAYAAIRRYIASDVVE